MRVGRGTPVVLLLAVIAGLFTMHTIGHLGPHTGGMSHAAALSTPMTHELAGDLLAGITGDSSRVLSAQPGGAPGLPGDLMALCVAILAAVTLAATIILLRRQPVVAVGPLGRRRSVGAGSRAPPPGIGLRLADLSVLRN